MKWSTFEMHCNPSALAEYSITSIFKSGHSNNAKLQLNAPIYSLLYLPNGLCAYVHTAQCSAVEMAFNKTMCRLFCVHTFTNKHVIYAFSDVISLFSNVLPCDL